jgi:integrase
MYTIPTIVTSDDLNKRSYVTFYFNGNRVREYNGSKIGSQTSPNRADSIAKRNELLANLRFEFHKALDANNYPNEGELNGKTSAKAKSQLIEVHEPIMAPSAHYLLFKGIRTKLRSDLSKKYKRNLKSIYRQFTKSMTAEDLKGPLISIPLVKIESFLNKFSSSGTYYMNKRRDLGVLFSAAGRVIDQPVETVQRSQKRKAKAKLHCPYENDQLKPILDYLKGHHPNLYICSLLTYGAWLRPHEEVRLLTKNDFKKGNTEVHLSGNENKGGKVRVVHIPEYIRDELTTKLANLKRDDNIFSLHAEPFNEYYFNTQWSRAWAKMYALGLIFENQTIYSFRHTAAVQLYRRTKDVHLLQQLLGHSSITVTLKYLRSLGEINSEELAKYAPQLD